MNYLAARVDNQPTSPSKLKLRKSDVIKNLKYTNPDNEQGCDHPCRC